MSIDPFKKFFYSNTIPKIIFILGVLLVFLLIFQAGFMIGFRKAAFSFDWNKNYISGPNDPRSIMALFMNDDDDVNPHGAVGEIISVNTPFILVRRLGGAEEIVRISTTTVIRDLRQIASTSDLVLHKQIVVIGEANKDGQIDATLIRILPIQTE